MGPLPRVLPHMLLLSAGMVAVSVLHDLLQCCIITDTQQLLQA